MEEPLSLRQDMESLLQMLDPSFLADLFKDSNKLSLTQQLLAILFLRALLHKPLKQVQNEMKSGFDKLTEALTRVESTHSKRLGNLEEGVLKLNTRVESLEDLQIKK